MLLNEFFKLTMSDLNTFSQKATKSLLNKPLKKLHSCPLNSWCDQCAYCELGHDELKRKFQQATEKQQREDLNAILEEKNQLM